MKNMTHRGGAEDAEMTILRTIQTHDEGHEEPSAAKPQPKKKDFTAETRSS